MGVHFDTPGDSCLEDTRNGISCGGQTERCFFRVLLDYDNVIRLGDCALRVQKRPDVKLLQCVCVCMCVVNLRGMCVL